jgi:phosphatidylserine decarboxylase
MKLHETFLKPMHPEGYRFVAIFAAVTLVLFWVWEPFGWIGAGLTVWCYYFFRDPVRAVPMRDGLIVSPADGVVSLIELAAPPPELGMGDAELTRISVFMSVFNCHVNRAPIGGVIAKQVYHPGQFLSASLDKASDVNERNSLIIALADGRKLAVVQIAGLVARRIVPFCREGQSLTTGERFGLIRFGSRLDVYLPEGVEPQVCLGQTMVAGESILADLGATEPARMARRV